MPDVKSSHVRMDEEEKKETDEEILFLSFVLIETKRTNKQERRKEGSRNTIVMADTTDQTAQSDDRYGGLQKKPMSAHLASRLEGKKRFDSADYQMQNQLLQKKKIVGNQSGLGNANAPVKD